eukprot:TRINITY_DN14519_c0_g2_i1.p1 TRINITY_DN14519_c0_g2~~TRINITY_DN14519_c0_g2_i1.p1  ORF type:complete len:367 (+),score=40.23 TRINITY_DN14519_c0_g2_i1:105-1205(+)
MASSAARPFQLTYLLLAISGHTGLLALALEGTCDDSPPTTASAQLQHDAQLSSKLHLEEAQDIGIKSRAHRSFQQISSEQKLSACSKILEKLDGSASTNVTADRLKALHDFCPRAYSAATCDLLLEPRAFAMMETAVGDPCGQLKAMLDATESHGVQKPIVLKQEQSTDHTEYDNVSDELVVLACKDILLRIEEADFYFNRTSTDEEKLSSLGQFCTRAFSNASCQVLVTQEAVDLLVRWQAGENEICLELDAMLKKAEQSNAMLLQRQFAAGYRRAASLDGALARKKNLCPCGGEVWCGPEASALDYCYQEWKKPVSCNGQRYSGSGDCRRRQQTWEPRSCRRCACCTACGNRIGGGTACYGFES